MVLETFSCDYLEAVPCDVIPALCQVIVRRLFSDGDFEWWLIVRNSLKCQKDLVRIWGISNVGRGKGKD